MYIGRESSKRLSQDSKKISNKKIEKYLSQLNVCLLLLFFFFRLLTIKIHAVKQEIFSWRGLVTMNEWFNMTGLSLNSLNTRSEIWSRSFSTYNIYSVALVLAMKSRNHVQEASFWLMRNSMLVIHKSNSALT